MQKLFFKCFVLFTFSFCVTSNAQIKPTADEQNVKSQQSHKFRLQLDGGYAFMTSSTSDAKKNLNDYGFEKENVNKYITDYISSYQANTQLIYFLNPQRGIGLKYSIFNTTAELNELLDIGDGLHLINSMNSNNLYVNYLGLSLYSSKNFTNNSNWLVYSSLSFGLAFYRDESVYFSQSMLFTGNNFALDEEVGLEYFISPNLSIGTSISLFICRLRKLTLDTVYGQTTQKLDSENAENISRLNGSVGIRLYW